MTQDIRPSGFKPNPLLTEDALVAEGEMRARYIAALRAVGARDYAPLLAFVRSGNAGA